MNTTGTIIVDECPMHRPAVSVLQARPMPHAGFRDFWELTKPRMNFLVLTTTAVGYYLAWGAPGDGDRFTATLLGTALTAAGTSVLNQLAERKFDALMRRTANRPLPAGRVRPIDALLFGAILSISGLLVLAVFVNPLTAFLGAMTIATYLLLYTPAKRRTTLCTIIGAVPGALPVVMGFAAASDQITLPALAMFSILFVWQIPHFLAIAILYRDDYAKASFRMLPVVDPDLAITSRQIELYSLALIPVSLFPFLLGTESRGYVIAAGLLAMVFCGFAIRSASMKNRTEARRLFLASILYLPCLLAAMTIDKI